MATKGLNSEMTRDRVEWKNKINCVDLKQN